MITLHCISGGGNLYQIAFSAPIAPVALGAKILKEPTATGDQNLRMDFDFSDTIANGADANIVEYGIILMGGTVSKATLTDTSNTARQVISREVASAASIPSMVTVTITNSAANSGKRVSAVAYVKDSDGNYYYSSNSDERVDDGVVVKSVMGVMKAWYLDAELDKTNAIATYAAEAQLQANDVAADLTKYATGEIGTADEKYEACKAALSGVFHHYYNG